MEQKTLALENILEKRKEERKLAKNQVCCHHNRNLQYYHASPKLLPSLHSVNIEKAKTKTFARIQTPQNNDALRNAFLQFEIVDKILPLQTTEPFQNSKNHIESV